MKVFLNKLRNKRWRCLAELLRLDWRLPSGLTVVIRSYSDWVTYNEIFVNQAYEDPIQDCIGASSYNMCVLDLGANSGMFSLKLADSFLQKRQSGTLSLFCVEGASALTKELKWRLPINNSRFAIQIINGLAGARDGTGVFNYSKEDNSNFVADSDRVDYWHRARGAERIPYVDLDLLTASIDQIDLVKCDIEGSEFLFIETYLGLLRKTTRLVVEFHLPFGNYEEAQTRLRKLGFDDCTILSQNGAVKTCYFRRS